MRILLTGASGFVGGEILRVLMARGADCVIASRRPDFMAAGSGIRLIPDLAQLDATQSDRLLKGIDGVIHAAGHAHAGPGSDPAIHANVNLHGTRMLADAAGRAGARLVYLSSIKAMGAADSNGVLRESMMREPDDAYGRSKRDAELAIRAALPEHHVILRPALVAGPGVKGNLATLLRLAASPLPLPFARQSARRSLISLADLADVAVRALREPRWSGQSMIVADPVPLSLSEIITAMRVGFGRKPRLFRLPENVLAGALRLSGRADWAERLFSPMMAESAFLLQQGWKPLEPVSAALQELARVARFPQNSS